MKISREWATALVIGAFIVMSATGLLMFFHWNVGLNKLAHEWVGWAMVFGVAAHVAANWFGFKRYFSTTLGKGFIGAGVVILAASFLAPPSAEKRRPPPVVAMNAITKAPLSALAPLSGRSVEQMLRDLAQAGVKIPSAEANLDSITAGDRKLEGKAINVLFGER